MTPEEWMANPWPTIVWKNPDDEILDPLSGECLEWEKAVRLSLRDDLGREMEAKE